MSSLLEQAIVDANALKEAALKNAENIVVEKYADEVKSVLTSLLEQEDPLSDLGDLMGGEGDAGDMAGGGDMGGMGDMGGGMPGQDVPGAVPGGGDSLDAQMAAGPDMGPEGEPEAEVAPSTEKMIEDLPASFLADASLPGSDKVLIDLDKLQEEIDQMGEVINEDFTLSGEFKGKEVAVEEESISETDLAPEDNDFSEPDEVDALDEIDIPDDDGLASDMLDEIVDEIYEGFNFDGDADLSGQFDRPSSEIEDELIKSDLAEEYDDAEELESAKQETEDAKQETEDAKQETAETKNENKTLRAKNKKILEENSKLRQAVEFFNKKLQETNLANAKLLYINQTQGNASLNERQKDKIVEAISKSGSIEEAKVIYETLQSTVGAVKSTLPQSLGEAINRKPSLTVPKMGEQQNRSSPLYERMQRLAGIQNI